MRGPPTWGLADLDSLQVADEASACCDAQRPRAVALDPQARPSPATSSPPLHGSPSGPECDLETARLQARDQSATGRDGHCGWRVVFHFPRRTQPPIRATPLTTLTAQTRRHWTPRQRAQESAFAPDQAGTSQMLP